MADRSDIALAQRLNINRDSNKEVIIGASEDYINITVDDDVVLRIRMKPGCRLAINISGLYQLIGVKK